MGDFSLENSVPCRCIVHHAIVKALGNVMEIKPYTGGTIGLGIRINQESLFFQYGKTGCQVNGCSRLAYSSFLICYSNDPGHIVLMGFSFPARPEWL